MKAVVETPVGKQMDMDGGVVASPVSNKKVFDEVVDGMNADSLMAANIIFLLTQKKDEGFTDEDALDCISEVGRVLKGLDEKGFFKEFKKADLSSVRGLVSRNVMINNLSVDDVVSLYKKSISAIKVNKDQFISGDINALVATTLCRAMGKYSDFVYGLVVYGDIDLDKYGEICDSANKVFVEFISRSVGTFEKIKARDNSVSTYLFLSIVEDIIASTINPLILAISDDVVLRKQFVNKSNSTLQSIRIHLNKKFNHSILLAFELMNVGV